MKKSMEVWLEIWFGNYKWCRRWVGGRWECWWIDCCCSMIWLKMDSRKDGRPGCGYGTPRVEQYHEPWMEKIFIPVDKGE